MKDSVVEIIASTDLNSLQHLHQSSGLYMNNHAPAISLQFDLSNSQHLDMRRLMADVYQRHARALNHDCPGNVMRYSGMAEGLEAVAFEVLKDPVLYHLCCALAQALDVQLRLHHRELSS